MISTLPDRIETRSRIKRWFLVNLFGYRVLLTKVTPVNGLFGQINHRHQWLLRKQEP